jgi:hypothetical protein
VVLTKKFITGNRLRFSIVATGPIQGGEGKRRYLKRQSHKIIHIILNFSLLEVPVALL